MVRSLLIGETLVFPIPSAPHPRLSAQRARQILDHIAGAPPPSPSRLGRIQRTGVEYAGDTVSRPARRCDRTTSSCLFLAVTIIIGTPSPFCKVTAGIVRSALPPPPAFSLCFVAWLWPSAWDRVPSGLCRRLIMSSGSVWRAQVGVESGRRGIRASFQNNEFCGSR